MTEPARTGGVVECYGRQVVVAIDATAERVQCKLRGRKLEVVAGDRVTIEHAGAGDEWVVATRLPRRNVLLRSDSRGGEESIAANLDQLGVVVAGRPSCDPYVVDRYIAGARYAGIEPLLVINKADLEFGTDELAYVDAFRQLGMPVVNVSARTRSGLDALIEVMRGKRTLLAGQSGVGKSSLTNALVGREKQATGDLSSGSGEGRHTTVSSSILAQAWGELADSPGVRDYAPPIVPLSSVQVGFDEISRRASGCRFQDCLHLREPQCAVLEALAGGRIDPRRYESYKRLVNLTRQLDERRGW
ncbi:MAG TPA: ribosome small subunit-dependent GTPase A [Steroidobacteraceae bacterium]